MKYIAHRGYSLRHRDNSIEAIYEALERGYDGIELDIQQCASGEIILYHDVYIDDQFINDMTFEELKSKSVCSLKEVYDTLPSIRRTKLFLDIKGDQPSIITELIQFYENESLENIFFCSFNRKLLYGLPSRFHKGSTFETTFDTPEYDIITKDLKAVVLHWTCLDHGFIAYCKMHGIRVFTYTHKESKELEYMKRYDVDGIITNGLT
jgi:glycerophosphoryl diester phosphodiesterase